MKNAYEIDGDVTYLRVNEKGAAVEVRIDTVDLARAQEFPGTWGVKRTPSGMTYVQGALAKRIVLLHRWIARAGAETRVRFRGDWRDHRRANLAITPRRSPARTWEGAEAAHQARRQAGWWLQLSLLLADRLDRSETAAWRLVDDWRNQRVVAKKTAAAIEACARELERGALPFPVAGPRRLRHHWYHHIPEIIEALRELPDAAWIGRPEVERVFALSRASALRVLVRFGARSAGRALGLDAKMLRERLAAFATNPAVSFEVERRERLEAALSEAGRIRKARAVRIRTAPGDGPALGDTVRLSRGKLEIAFRDLEDLLRQLLELGQAMASDYDGFVTRYKSCL